MNAFSNAISVALVDENSGASPSSGSLSSTSCYLSIDGGSLQGTTATTLSTTSYAGAFGTDVKPMMAGYRKLAVQCTDGTNYYGPAYSSTFSVLDLSTVYSAKVSGSTSLTIGTTYSFSVQLYNKYENPHAEQLSITLNLCGSQYGKFIGTSSGTTNSEGLITFSLSLTGPSGSYYLYPVISGTTILVRALAVTLSAATYPTSLVSTKISNVAIGSPFSLTIKTYVGNGYLFTTSRTISLAISGGSFYTGVSTSRSTSSGSVTFSDLIIDPSSTAGTYTITASDSSGTSTSISFTASFSRNVVIKLNSEPYFLKTIGTYTYSIYLSSLPLSSVTVSISSSNTGLITVSPASLVFTTSDYSSLKTVTLTVISGGLTNSKTDVSIIHSTSTTDSTYSSPKVIFYGCDRVSSSGTLTVSILNTLVPGSFSLSGTFYVIEGSSSTFSLSLTTSISSNVQVSLSNSDGLTFSPSSLTFTSSDYSASQSVTVSASKGLTGSLSSKLTDITYSVSSSDSMYSASITPTTSFVITSPISSSAYLVQSHIPVLKENDSTSYSVNLNTNPSSSVTLTLTSSSSELNISPSSFTLSSTSSQTISLNHVPSAYPTSLVRSFTVTHQMSSSDQNYDGSGRFSIEQDLKVYIINPCLYGEYYLPGSFTCGDCPTDYRCPSPIQAVLCSAGEYSPSGQVECLPCPPGYECNPGTAGQASCASGYYSLGYSSSCIQCPAGSACQVADASPSDCPLGTYSTAGSSSCTALNSGQVGFPWETPITCTSGYIPSAYSTHCEKCPAGHYCNDPTSRSIIPCSSGYYSPGVAASCTQCPSGKACSRAEELGVCPEGFYSEAGMSSCVQCLVGFYCTSGSKLACSGSYRVGMKTCSGQSCPAQHYCVQGLPPMPCPPGYVSPLGETTCTVCSLGTYQSGNNCIDCPAGFFCSNPVSPPVACYFGTYSYARSQSCTICDSGYTCGQGSSSPTQLNCPGGFECTEVINAMTGVDARWPVPCAGGKYNPGSTSACSDCPAGFYCPGGVRDFQKFRCPPGHYCGSNSQSPTSCDAGTYNINWESTNLGQCITCPSGYYSLKGSAYCYVCPPGAYCINGVMQSCSSGTYYFGVRGTSSSVCKSCPPGYYCDTNTNSGHIVPTSCPAFTYNLVAGGTSVASCLDCPAGYWCPLPATSNNGRIFECPPGSYCTGTGNYTECLAGTYNYKTGSSASTDCLACPAGYVCPSTSTSHNNPKLSCSLGSYCPSSSTTATACPAGTYSKMDYLTQSSECTTCPAGYFCPGGTTYPIICKPGQYCTRGATSGTNCPAGTYSPFRGVEDSAYCIKCPKGFYCLAGRETPTACSGGTYSSSLGTSLSTCTTCPVGHRCPGTGLKKPFVCGKGFYYQSGCPSNYCSTCPAGRFCNYEATSQTVASANRCPAGLWCGTRMDRYPTNLLDRCPAGSYCPYGQTSLYLYCPAGTLRRIKGGAALADCINVEAGYYVSTTGASSPTGECSEGYYCPAGSTSSTQNPCPAGTYRLIKGGKSLSDCGECPSGFYCSSGSSSPSSCPTGSYCAEGDSSSPTYCPEGTYNPAIGMNRLSDCISCPKGYYCSSAGRTTKSGSCYAGYLCLGSAVNAYGGTTSGAVNVCPSTGYCPAGTPRALPCPPGKYMTTTGSSTTGNCQNCPGGKYCAGATNSASGDCEAGFYCTGGASTSRQYIASEGHYTLAGASSQTACAAGTFNPAQGQSSCITCQSGSYCSGTGNTEGTICPAGNYCPAGSSSGTNCPPGTYNPFTGMKALSDCIPCPPHYACPSYGMTSVSSLCSAGFWCYSEASTTSPTTEVSEKYGPCPAGYYCAYGSSAPRPCGPGTYNPDTLQISVSACLACPSGSYCEGFARTTPSGNCEPGFYCPSGQKTKRPIAYICPEGSYCLSGSLTPTSCQAGSFQANMGQESCEECPPGFYCPSGTTDFSLNICPKGYYCPAGTTNNHEYPCPSGTYNPIIGATSNTFCVNCDPGKYCSGTGLYAVSGTCNGGFICTGSSDTPTPSGSGGEECIPGYYCPSGGNVMIFCKAGYYCETYGLSAPTGLCDSGYYCTGGSTISNPTSITGGICPAGHYCPSGSISPIPCKAGTYNPNTGESSISACTICSAGRYCQGTGLTSDSGSCTAGFYCPEGSVTSKANICPAGSYCPAGYGINVLTTGGYYQWRKGQSNRLNCPVGYYCRGNGVTKPTICNIGLYCTIRMWTNVYNRCPRGTYNPVYGRSVLGHCLPCPAGMYCSTEARTSPTGLCPAGFYCPQGSIYSTDYPCAEGTYCPIGVSKEIPCKPGKYCSGTQNSAPDGDCAAGYYCKLGSTTSTPTNGIEGDICPKGYYCPSGSSVPIPCPIGTFNRYTGKSSLSDCVICTRGYYCALIASFEETGICKAGFFCVEGSTTDTPDDGLCPLGSYCPDGSYQSISCPIGYYGNFMGLSSCFVCPSGFTCQGGTAKPIICTEGYYCPEESSVEIPCASNSYNPFKGQSVCIGCPAGFYCHKSNANDPITAPKICEPGFYCPANQMLPCPSGTYSEIQGLQREDNCKPCPIGKYCSSDSVNGGRIIGDCSSGYYCVSGMVSPTPSLIYTDSQVGMPCPLGYYCLESSSKLIPCPYGKFTTTTGADEESDCTDCVEGFYCVPGDTVPYSCPTGSFCPTASQSPTVCPRFTYNDIEEATSLEYCKTCPKGYLCNEDGIGDFSRFPCTYGHYCPSKATVELPCPIGTWGPVHALGSASECYSCPVGSYCKTHGRATYTHCQEWRFCDSGSTTEGKCPGGYYCHHNTLYLTPCPGGYYCPETSFLSKSPPFRCQPGYYCPPGSSSPIPCPWGTVYVIHSLRTSKSDSCVACPPGTYSQVSECLPCDAGFLCINGASKPQPESLEQDGGYPCPPGFYCPRGSFSGVPCPVGHHYPDKGATSIDFCAPCDAGMYNDQEGQGGCFKCGPNADSAPGSDTCSCVGLNRAYMKRDGTCRCKPGFTYYKEGITPSEEDSPEDCVPIIIPICSSGTIRGHDGQCVSSTDCSSSCEGGKGERSAQLGVCTCFNSASIDDVCDEQCQSETPKVQLAADGTVTVKDPVSGSEEKVDFQSTPGFTGKPKCLNGLNCEVKSVQMASGVFQSDFKTNVGGGSRRQLSSGKSISNPVYCLEYGDTMIFNIESQTAFPVYVKDSLLNTNKEFDYSQFLELKKLIEEANQNVTTFAYTFVDPGRYVFANNDNSESIIIIQISKPTEKCSSPYLRERTTSTLTRFGVSQSSQKEESSWLKFFILISCFGSFSIMVIFIYTFQKKSKQKSSKSGTKVFRRMLARNASMVGLLNEGQGKTDMNETKYGRKSVSDLSEMRGRYRTELNETKMGKFDLRDGKGRKVKVDLDETNLAALDESMIAARHGIFCRTDYLDPVVFSGMYRRLEDISCLLSERANLQKLQELEYVEKIKNSLKDMKGEIQNALNPLIHGKAGIVVRGEGTLESVPFTPSADPETQRLIEKITKDALMSEHTKRSLIDDLMNSFSALEAQFTADTLKATAALKPRIEARLRQRRDLLLHKKQLEDQERQLKEQKEKIQQETRTQLADLDKESEKDKRRAREKVFGNTAKNIRREMLEKIRKVPENEQFLIQQYEEEMKNLEKHLEGERAKAHYDALAMLEKRKNDRKQQIIEKNEMVSKKFLEVSRELERLSFRAKLSDSVINELGLPAVAKANELSELEERIIDRKFKDLQRTSEVLADSKLSQLRREKQKLSSSLAYATSTLEIDQILLSMTKLDEALESSKSQQILDQRKILSERLKERRKVRKERQLKHPKLIQPQDSPIFTAFTDSRVSQLQAITKDLPQSDQLQCTKEILTDKHDHELQTLHTLQSRRAAQLHADYLRESLDCKVEATRLAPSMFADLNQDQQRSTILSILNEIDPEIEADFLKHFKENQKINNDELESLLEQQLNEVLDTFKRLGIDEKISMESHRIEREFRLRKAEMEKEARERMERIEKHKQEMVMLVNQKKSSLDEQFRMAKAAEEVERAKRALMEKQKRELQEKAVREGLSNAQIERMIAQHSKELKNLDLNLEVEKKRQKENLEAKLKEKIIRRRNKMNLPDDLKEFETETAHMMKNYRGSRKDNVVFDDNLVEELLRRIRRIEKVVANIDERQVKKVINRVRALKTVMK